MDIDVDWCLYCMSRCPSGKAFCSNVCQYRDQTSSSPSTANPVSAPTSPLYTTTFSRHRRTISRDLTPTADNEMSLPAGLTGMRTGLAMKRERDQVSLGGAESLGGREAAERWARNWGKRRNALAGTL
ncbi:uncharacterized protein VTP21DRAFT_4844 [Calcarisporiella thermophila]|uniref:uncharacterized protein n=1 Tax=Calcarisporiella thermophila TaxID=911321 RepID=UPI0037440AFA